MSGKEARKKATVIRGCGLLEARCQLVDGRCNKVSGANQWIGDSTGVISLPLPHGYVR